MSNIILLSCLGIILSYCFDRIEENPEILQETVMFEPQGIPLFFGIAAYALEGNTMILYYHDQAKNP